MLISGNTIGLGEGEDLQKICNALPIRQDIANNLSFTGKRHIQIGNNPG
jgi:hypothetical protein